MSKDAHFRRMGHCERFGGRTGRTDRRAAKHTNKSADATRDAAQARQKAPDPWRAQRPPAATAEPSEPSGSRSRASRVEWDRRPAARRQRQSRSKLCGTRTVRAADSLALPVRRVYTCGVWPLPELIAQFSVLCAISAVRVASYLKCASFSAVCENRQDRRFSSSDIFFVVVEKVKCCAVPA